jgi:hypothetical protein
LPIIKLAVVLTANFFINHFFNPFFFFRLREYRFQTASVFLQPSINHKVSFGILQRDPASMGIYHTRTMVQ